MTTIFQRACAAVDAGQTDPAEVRRVLGFADASQPRRMITVRTSRASSRHR